MAGEVSTCFPSRFRNAQGPGKRCSGPIGRKWIDSRLACGRTPPARPQLRGTHATLPVGVDGGATGPHVVRMRRSIRIANPLVPAAERSRGPAFEPSSQPTLRWREMDSNFRFRVRCKRGLRRKSPASAVYRRRSSALPSAAISSGARRNLGTEPLSRTELEVRIHLPPAGSPLRTRFERTQLCR